MTNIANLATRYAGRPLLIAPTAAEDLARRIRALDGRAFSRPGRLGAFMRRIGMSGSGPLTPLAMEDDYDGPPPPPIEERLAYAPLWLGEAEDAGYCWTLKDGVALMNADTALVARGTEFCGEVYHGYDTLLRAFRDAATDDRVRGIFLRLDSPGGVVDGGMAALSKFMREAREAGGGKPIWVYADMACSAAYWIAAQADRIVAPRVGYVGSIGAVIVHEDWSQRLAEDGIVVTPIQFGEQKTDGAWFAKLSERARATLQSDVDQCGREFVAEVVAGRATFTADALLATQAGVFMGHHDDPDRNGMTLGFVDALGDEEETFLELVEHVAPGSARNPAPVSGQPQAEAPRGAPAASEEEQTMSKTNGPKTAARAVKPGADADPKDDATAETDREEGDEEDEDEDDKDEGGDAKAASNDAEAIAASAEAKANPAAALSAIQAGLSLKQFQAMAPTMGASAPQRRLPGAMAGASRLGPDSAKAASGRAAFGSALTGRAEARRKEG